MQTLRTIDSFRAARSKLAGKVALVPTMGALHSGHVGLMEYAQELADHVVVSIFVNPTQFGPNEDLDVYPRDEEGDLAKCQAAGVALVFTPPPSEMYANGQSQLTFVDMTQLTDDLCGASRSGHFRGVTTVVTKLFNIMQPDIAVFGQKDYQQFAVLRQMALDLNMPVEVVSMTTVREADGLAMSSRNRNLRPEERQKALSLSRGLIAAWSAWDGGERDAEQLQRLVQKTMTDAGAKVDYATAVDPVTLQRLVGEETTPKTALIAAAGFIGNVRLIDNLRLDEPLPDALRDLK
jgi:pantoate--beta-alanine ligase